MPPLPKRKYPKARQGARRSHLQTNLPHLVVCSRCGSPRLTHTACPTCGTYRDRQVLEVEEAKLPGGAE